MDNGRRLDWLEQEGIIPEAELDTLLDTYTSDDQVYAAAKARRIAKQYFGNEIYIRGLIECTNYCRNDCYYCGIRRSNDGVSRYRLQKEAVLDCCQQGYELGFRTFVLQGGEDGQYNDDFLIDIISAIKARYDDCALTLSLGEKSYDSYLKYYQAGADRYLLRHETADGQHYQMLHPESLTLKNRKQCLYNLKEIGYQTGCGGMIGSPYQTKKHLVKDLLFIHELKPQMVGIGPFLPHHQTPFKDLSSGSLSLTLFFLSLVRIMEKNVLLPATTALATLDPEGRKMGILSGANVVMPNLSPVDVRKQYMLYDNKVSSGKESAQAIEQLRQDMEAIGYHIVVKRGDWSST